ncbi:LysR family transcriptional regulator [Pseudomonas oryzihabitans]|uniref:LysR family transcriptional regulator n=1 Tax=Pseudomonas oryzihabitans TaxID=47885 RepID=A0A0U4P209_9PSED|nr:LysR family transcriptional regulator [Pseudomonas oryzihabitans]ALZ84961.1 LysR family transcriptional regulator [Pseudomonas oryzihabitans]
MDFSLLADFQLIATHGGIGKASRASGRPKASLSRRLAELEEALGIRLIERGGRSLVLTPAGVELAARTLGPLREIQEAVAAVQEGVAVPRGRLRIAAPLLFSQVALGRLSADFRRQYPEILIEVVAEDRLVDLVEEHFDLAIRINPAPDSTLVGRCFARDRRVLVAAPGLEGPLASGAEPARLPAVVMPGQREGEVWTLTEGGERFLPQPVLQLTSLLTIREAVLAGAGAALLPLSLVQRQLDEGALRRWGTLAGETELWVLHTSRRLQSPKVKAFVAFLCARYPDGTFLLD